MDMPSKKMMLIIGAIAAIGIFLLARYFMLKSEGIKFSLTTIFFGKGVGSECTDDESCGSDKLVCADTSKCIAKEE
tara:strand:+ start:67 stop:294 length:228 start_codon:yes stop_codon:yes gene_type:complete